MARGSGGISVDIDETLRLAGVMKGLNQEMNTDRHLNHVSRAAYTILAAEFNAQTHAHAKANVENLHHIYEWEHVGVPGFQLYQLNLRGRGGNHTVSWDWRASKTTVPTMTTVTGEAKFEEGGKFDPTKLRRIHVFVWKAPMMEYGVSVTVRPKLSKNKLLVFPDAELRHTGNKPSPAVFTPHLVTTKPGALVQGNFTSWFTAWWGGGIAEGILKQTFEKKRDAEFARTFERLFPDAPRTKMKAKSISITPNGAAARQGKNIAKAMARDMEHKYIEMARQRARLLGGDDEDE